MPAPNLLLLLADDDRFDAFAHAVFGGALFRATSQATLCAPSRLSLLTGTPPYAHGVLNNDFTPHELYVRAARGRSIVDVARENGYLVAGVGKLFHIDAVETAQRYDVPAPALHDMLLHRDCAETNASQRRPWPVEPPRPHRWGDAMQCMGVTFQDQHIASEAIRVANDLRAKNQSFALFVGFLRPHVPMQVPPGYALPTDVPEPVPECAGWFPEVPEPTLFKNAVVHDCTLSREGTLEMYNGARRYVYAQMRRVINAVPRNTLIVRTSDHGLNLGESCVYGKMGAFNRLATTVPLEIWAPWRTVVRTPVDVQLMDVLPTIADALNWTTRIEWGGQSLLHPHAGRRFVTTNSLGASIRDHEHRLTLRRLGVPPFAHTWSPLASYEVAEFATHATNCPANDPLLEIRLRIALLAGLKPITH